MMTQLKEKAADLRETIVNRMGEDVTFTKLDFCLISAVLFLAGICIGLLTAPWTHGIAIGSNNGNYGNNSNITQSNISQEEDEEDGDEACEE